MKIQYLFLLVILNYYLVNAQTINIPIITSDGVSPFLDTLRFGLDLTATDCIDSLLGEPTISPPIPPGGVFYSIFQLPSFCTPLLTTKLDFRNAPAFPFTGQKEHRLLWQHGFGSSSFTLFYNFPGGITANIRDLMGGALFNQNLQNSGSYTITFPFNAAILTVYYDNVVPVEFYSFTSSYSGTYVSLNWVTASETNNQGFDIERLKDEKIERLNEWEKIGFVKGNGTTTETHSYSFIDKDLQSGKVKYRLKQIDYDGTFEYSNVVEVSFMKPNEFSLEQNYPNPFNPTTTIKFSIPTSPQSPPSKVGEAKQGWFTVLKIFDILGNEVATLVNEYKPAGTYEVEFNAEGIASGVFFYQLKTGNYITTKKLTILK